jgi:ankyrin repeat protein
VSETGLDLEQQRRRARELLQAARQGDAAALARLRQHHPLLAGSSDAELLGTRLALHHAQLVIAREEGFASWPRLRAEAERRLDLRRSQPIERDLSWYEDRARGLVSAHQAGLVNAFEPIRQWHPRFRQASDEEVGRAPFSLADARLVYARQHGSPDWARFEERIQSFGDGAARPPFMAAFEALRARDVELLRELVESHPDLVRARGTNGNSLLNLACSFASRTCDEDVRRLSLDAVRLLLAAGADVNAPNDRGWTPLHQAGHEGLIEMLIDAGAAVDREAHGAGGTPLAVALFWGNRETADLLARRGVVPLNLRVAAGLGRPDLVDRLVDPRGRLAPEAFRGRGFYRPHSGFPVWHPTVDPQVVLDEALAWASRSGRVEVLPVLVALGARVDADPYRGTPLLWAAAKGRIETAAWLLDRGADVNQRATFGGPSHGEGVTALHLAAQNGDLPTARFLVERGADPTIEDAIYHSSPVGWAEQFEHEEVRRYLEGRAG